jgi:hypothetical protein
VRQELKRERPKSSLLFPMCHVNTHIAVRNFRYQDFLPATKQ